MTGGQSPLHGFDSTIIGVIPIKIAVFQKGAFFSELLQALRNCVLVQFISLQLGASWQCTAVSMYEARASFNICSSLETCPSSGDWPLNNYLFCQAQLCIYDMFPNIKSGS